MKKLILNNHFGVALFFLLFSSSARAEDVGKSDIPPSPAPYVIQPSDHLEVFVWKEAELSRKVAVRPDGRISLPLVQDLQAAGLTPEELRANIAEKLKEYIDSPNVTVIIAEIRNYKIYVTGKVNNPGPSTLETPVTVLQALSLAGGFQEYADPSNITIFRNNGKTHEIFEFDYKEVIKGKKARQNITLRSGDVVVVP